MCIYCGTNKYRKMYESHFGPIPKDGEGRSYEIHHIDGNNKNNNLNNLKCVSIQEHYDIHYNQNDWKACSAILRRRKINPQELSRISSLREQERIRQGAHPFQKRKDGSSIASDRVKNGTHPFQKKPDGSSISRRTQLERSKKGIHVFQSDRHKQKVTERNQRRAKNKDDNFYSSQKNRERALERVANGTHPSKISKTCEHCKKEISLPNFSRWHGDRCKNKPASSEA